MERNSVERGKVAHEVGGWAEHTRGGAKMERLGAVVAIVVMETLRVATPHSHATELTRNGVACYSVMRVCPLSGGRGGVGHVHTRGGS